MPTLSELLVAKLKAESLSIATAASRARLGLLTMRHACDGLPPNDPEQLKRLADFLGITTASLIPLTAAGQLDDATDDLDEVAPPGPGETGLIVLLDAARMTEVNTEYPYLLRTGRQIIGTTRDGSPAVIGLTRDRLAWIGLVHDMYYGATDAELAEQPWNVAWVARSLTDYVRASHAGRMPIDGCAASRWTGTIALDR